jgi:site-specific recombinase XerD
MKIDLYNHEPRYNSWKEHASKKDYIEGNLTKKNSDVLLKYIFDMEVGANVSLLSKKGGRSFMRLNTIRTRLTQLFIMFQEKDIPDITKITEQQLQDFFSDMRNGKIKNRLGEKYKSTADYVKTFKAFWHWHIKVSKKKEKLITDVTTELDSSRDEKPKWVYLDESQMKLLLEKCEPRYKPFLSFLYDSGARVTESFSLLVQDIHEEKNIVYVNIRDETSKTFGRKIKLLLCGKDLLEYIKRSELKPEDRLFGFSPEYTNRYLGELAKQLFGEKVSKAGAKYSDLSMYDFRHNSCCYWIQRYKNNTGLMFRFGWKTEKYILYYSEFLGMRDLISQEDLYIDITKTELEKQLEQQKKDFVKSEGEKRVMQDKIQTMENQMKVIAEATDKLVESSKKLKDYDFVPKNKKK